jgi:hypothetical protein
MKTPGTASGVFFERLCVDPCILETVKLYSLKEFVDDAKQVYEKEIPNTAKIWLFALEVKIFSF